jgi:alpha-beta hydrolase superfamily lysophospholipase
MGNLYSHIPFEKHFPSEVIGTVIQHKVHVTVYTVPNPKAVVIFGLGSVMGIADNHQAIHDFAQEIGMYIVAFDHPGNGPDKNTKPTQSNVYENGLTVYDWIKSSTIYPPGLPMIMFGYSLGSAIVTHIAPICSALGFKTNSIFPTRGLWIVSIHFDIQKNVHINGER